MKNNPVRYKDPTGHNEVGYGFATVEEIYEMMKSEKGSKKEIRIPQMDKDGNITGFFNFRMKNMADPKKSITYATDKDSGLMIEMFLEKPKVMGAVVDEYVNDLESQGRFLYLSDSLDNSENKADYKIAMKNSKGSVSKKTREEALEKIEYFVNSDVESRRETLHKEANKEGYNSSTTKIMFVYLTDIKTSDNPNTKNSVIDMNQYNESGEFEDHNIDLLKGRNAYSIMKKKDNHQTNKENELE